MARWAELHSPVGDLRTSREPGVPRRTPATGRRAPPRGVDVKQPPRGWSPACPGPRRGQKPEKRVKNPKSGSYPAFLAILTETATILKIPNRSGFQSNPDFLTLLKSRTPGGGQEAHFQDPASPAGVVLHQPLAAGPCPRDSEKGGLEPPAGRSGDEALTGPRCGKRASADPGIRDRGTGPRREGLM